MSASAELTKLDPNTFEHMVTMLAMRVLGPGHTGFGPGADGGRDGYFSGEAPYPSVNDRWKGRWYIQCKFHSPHLSKDPQKWLIERIEEEITEFKKTDSKRRWPDNWIIATNIEPSGHPMTGAFDKANKLLTRARPKLRHHFHIWGGNKLLQLLNDHPEVKEYYEHFLTPGHILTSVYNQLKDSQAEAKTILRYLIVTQFGEQQLTKLDQAGSGVDTRPGIHKVFIDLPFISRDQDLQGLAVEYLVRTSAKNHQIDPNQPDTKQWRLWNRFPARARVWFMKGGPGQGKSTISQYFCQIQRAALILQDDGPTVLPQQRSVAREIQRIAKQAAFWPVVPRIPISIELKEYAQWYGQQKKGSARGILSYLASRIEAGVEQKVQVGTLKRALQTRSWFVVFDGLDEVPHDVKDGVAAEVCNFVDNVSLELDADLLTMCTSRPQGYSGQFSQLDGPTIELASLSANQALECAKPVLALERSAEEARKSLQILSSAIESSSVRELMTTPLQAHIMAVVVRDGGRPPDRRWNLFTNFYQVIKKREANRDLPDRRLAKLLREDTQLLKSVHNRLGFVLQATAETSKGAQTNLKRSEFEALVSGAVSQMIEGETTEIVGILMEATTDRLVLVSTPDDGDHVRFDIRPLQEFFASEFFYEAVSATTLHSRMELVAGDSHWREVMHFLVSALIENSRLTELSVAIAVLQQLDDGEGEPHERLLARRLARGALLTSRLLQEGVLEQDKRIRQQMRRCLEPITGLIDPKPLKSLASIRQPNSRSWLLSFLFESLREQDYTENVGAAITLALMLRDDDEGIDEFKAFLLSAPPEYKSIIVAASMADISSFHLRPDAPVQFQKWFIELVIALLTQPNWFLMETEAISTSITLLRHAKSTLRVLFREGRLTELEFELMLALLKEPKHEIDPKLDFGFLKGNYYSWDWTAGSPAPNITVPPNSLELRNKGILDLLFKLFRFATQRTHPNLVSLIESLKHGETKTLSALPPHVRALIPIEYYRPIPEQLTALSSLDDSSFTSLVKENRLNSRVIPRPIQWQRLGTTDDCDSWKKLIHQDPEFALRLWTEDFWEGRPGRIGRPQILDDQRSIEFLVDALIQHPLLLSEVPNVWGLLLAKAPNRQSELRTAFLKAGNGMVPTKFWVRPPELHLFKLNLPAEASLLPFLLSAVCEAYSFSDRYHEDFWHPHPRLDFTQISFEIAKMVPDVHELEVVINNPKLGKSVQAAAMFLALMHSNTTRTLTVNAADLANLYTKESSSWYFNAVISLVTVLPDNSVNAPFIGLILERTREDYAGRQELQRLLTRWREDSMAPVQSSKVRNDWLTTT
jgi:hypothetical protein